MLWTPESQKPLNEEMTPFKWELTSTRKHRTAFIHLLQYVSSSLFYRISFILSIVYQMFFLQCFLQLQFRPWKWVWNTLGGLQNFPSLPEEFWLASSLIHLRWKNQFTFIYYRCFTKTSLFSLYPYCSV